MGYGLMTVRKDTVALHGSCIVYKGKAVLFLGESGTGKSELLDACLRVCEQKGLSAAPVYDDHGTLHYLDEEIVSTGGESVP